MVKCRVASRDCWEQAVQAAGYTLPEILGWLEGQQPSWWDGSGTQPPGLTEYQREAILARFNDNELHLLRRDLALNQFVLLDRLGQGGQGQVYRARQLNPPRFAAVKVLIQDTENRRKRFEKEAKAMIRIQHPAVARFYLYERIRDAHGDPTDEYLIALEFVNGTDLQRLIRKNGPVPWPFAVHWVATLLSGLDAIHRHGFIHRDVKPENTMIVGRHPGSGASVEETSAKLLDFGAVNRVGEGVERSGTSRVFVGTMEYAAPEQWHGEMDVATDIYALGGTLFFMLTGRPPFRKERRDPQAYMNAHLREEPPDINAFNAETPPEVNRLYRRMMSKNFMERGNAAELMAEFQRLVPREASTPPPSPPPANPSRAKPSPVDSPPPVKAPVARRSAQPPAEESHPAGFADKFLALLESALVPASLRPRSGSGVTAAERVLVILRQPLVLIMLGLFFVLVLVLVLL